MISIIAISVATAQTTGEEEAMPNHTLPTDPATSKQIPEQEELRTLAAFRDPSAHAVSFCYSLHSFPDKSHHTEKVALGKLVQDEVAKFRPGAMPELLSSDLNQILAMSDDIQRTPTLWRAVYACGEQKIWREFDLPAPEEIAQLSISSCFLLVPLLAAIQSCRRYRVVLMESGKTRLFEIQGSEVRGIPGRLSEGDLTQRSEDSRVGWSKRVDGNVEHQERAWFRLIVDELGKLPGEQGPGTLVVGCRNDIWGEARPYFAALENNTIMGRFHLPGFGLGAQEVLKEARPIFEQYQLEQCKDLLHAIDDDNGRGAHGLHAVLKALAAGRVQKMLLGDMTGQTANECGECGRIQPELKNKCAFCRSSQLVAIPADEALVRLALAQKVEILHIPSVEEETFHGVAAMLR
ncbi:MAG TPA: hypothetical protein VND66_06200, partial [Acidobacteriaceae bacterium]|nr:hypothetical protein [Acidobacteriaceae bacterium]